MRKERSSKTHPRDPAESLSRFEVGAVVALGLVLSLRMLGLFMIYPIFSQLASHYAGATAFTIGLALGSYGLTQGIFQLPFGWLSDRWGRKTVIVIGLLLFAVGSAMAALSTTITGLIAGRLVQGLGAIGSTTLAFISDVTHEEHRTRAMATAGGFIGLSFGIAIVLGPLLARAIGLAGIFWLTGFLALAAIALVLVVRPPAWSHRPVPDRRRSAFRSVLAHRDLRRLDFGILIQHAVLTSLFLVLPQLTHRALGMDAADNWLLYLPLLAGAFVLSLPFVILAEIRAAFRPSLRAGILALGIGLGLLLAVPGSAVGLVVGLGLYFAAFTLLEALLPSWVSRITPVGFSGSGLGVYSSFQFLGIFLGGAVGGLVWAQAGIRGVLVLDLLALVAWFGVAWPLANVRRCRTLLFRLPGQPDVSLLRSRLDALDGVLEWRYAEEEGVLYLRVEPRLMVDQGLQSLRTQFGF
jgi:predicted MFS family arabinose efflux permease